MDGLVHFGICMSPADDNLPTPISALNFRGPLPECRVSVSVVSVEAFLSNGRIGAVHKREHFEIFLNLCAAHLLFKITCLLYSHRRVDWCS